jgi:serine/threonine protein kinase
VWKSILVDKLDLETPALKSSMSPAGLDLLKKLLVRDPAERISACEALKHPWIKVPLPHFLALTPILSPQTRPLAH